MDRVGILSIARLRLQDSAGFVGGSPRTGQRHATVPLEEQIDSHSPRTKTENRRHVVVADNNDDAVFLFFYF